MHEAMSDALDESLDAIRAIQTAARTDGFRRRHRWPMIILRSPKGWTGPAMVDGVAIEGTFRAHQVPLTGFARPPVAIETARGRGCAVYAPETLFDENGALRADLAALARPAMRRMSANPHANGGLLLRGPALPDFPTTPSTCLHPARSVPKRRASTGAFLRDVMRVNASTRNFRVMGPDETASNRLGAPVRGDRPHLHRRVVEPGDDHVTPDGRVMEVLSEHLCQGWLEGYLLTGRHGFFSCYEAFIHIVDSMFNQHAKWLKVTRKIPWRRPIASLNYLLTSHVWRQDHNGFSHQDPGFIDHVVNKKADVVRVYLPPDANTPAVGGRSLPAQPQLRERDRRRQGARRRSGSTSTARAHATARPGIGIWEWASNDDGASPTW